MARRLALLSFGLALACTPGPSTGVGATHASLTGLARVEVVRTISSAPAGGDGAPLVELRVTSESGDEHLFAPVLGGIAFGDGALVLDAERGLSLGDSTGHETRLDTDVSFVPVVSPGGDHFVYARSEDGASFALVSRSANARAVLAEGLASIGAVHFVDVARFVFVGGRSGGVAGLFFASTASSDLAVCLTNCELRTGQPWGDAFAPTPADLRTLALDGDVLSYEDASGTPRRVTIPAGASR